MPSTHQSPRTSRSDVTVNPKALKFVRGVRGFSQEKLADESDTSSGLIANIETGRRQPGLANLFAIAKALDIDPEVIAEIHVDLSAFTDQSAA